WREFDARATRREKRQRSGKDTGERDNFAEHNSHDASCETIRRHASENSRVGHLERSREITGGRRRVVFSRTQDSGFSPTDSHSVVWHKSTRPWRKWKTRPATTLGATNRNRSRSSSQHPQHRRIRTRA